MTDIKMILRGLGHRLPADNCFYRWSHGRAALVPPAVRGKRGRGNPDRWDLAGVILLRFVLMLRSKGIPLQILRKGFEYLHAELIEAIASQQDEFLLIITRGSNVVLVKPGEPISVELSELSGQIIALDWIMVRDTVNAVENKL